MGWVGFKVAGSYFPTDEVWRNRWGEEIPPVHTQPYGALGIPIVQIAYGFCEIALGGGLNAGLDPILPELKALRLRSE